MPSDVVVGIVAPGENVVFVPVGKNVSPRAVTRVTSQGAIMIGVCLVLVSLYSILKLPPLPRSADSVLVTLTPSMAYGMPVSTSAVSLACAA
jgi:hypothetical protein